MGKATADTAEVPATPGRPRLNVPEPGFRHGEPLSFAHLHIAPAVRRPRISATSDDVRLSRR